MDMVERQIRQRGVTDQEVLEAMERVPRHEFVPSEYQSQAYADRPLPIGYGQTISQPYIVALMTELLQLQNTDRVLEIGTGSGYQAAILGEIVAEVYTVEIIEALAVEAKARLERLRYANVHALHADGYQTMAHDVLKTAPRGFSADHPRIELLRHKGIAVMKSWPVGAWLGTARAKDRVVTALRAAAPLNAWLDRRVG